MSTQLNVIAGVLLDESSELTLEELARACGVQRGVLVEMVEEGLLEPVDRGLAPWRFHGPALQRVRAALRLQRDLELNLAGTALILDLLGEIERLERRLHCLGSAR